MPHRPSVDPRFDAWLSRSISRRSLLVSSATLCAMPYGSSSRAAPRSSRRGGRRRRLRSASPPAIRRRRASFCGPGSRSIPSTAAAWIGTRAGELGNRVGRPHAADREERHGDGDCRVGASVHVEVDGLAPDRWYWYRFRTGDAESSIGRTRTLPTADSTPPELRVRLRLVPDISRPACSLLTSTWPTRGSTCRPFGRLHLRVRRRGGRRPQARSAARSSRSPITASATRSTRPIRRSRRCTPAAPWLVTWDDHEAREQLRRRHFGERHPPTRFSSSAPPPTGCTTSTSRSGGAVRADPPRSSTAEPLRHAGVVLRFGHAAVPHGPAVRRRQQAAVRGDARSAGHAHGRERERWLFERLCAASAARWHVLAQQVMMARVDHAGRRARIAMDQWPGYDVERKPRDELSWRGEAVANPVVLTGDIHSDYVNELWLDFYNLDSKTVGAEFVGTSISSGGDGAITATAPPRCSRRIRS